MLSKRMPLWRPWQGGCKVVKSIQAKMKSKWPPSMRPVSLGRYNVYLIFSVRQKKKFYENW